ncbi:hypothetical protein E2C01_032483 [Portunus trituberculatus]|uniref:Uncharacterized protein n=1 Tax=Portunus trituberculatus TaxID=210409 RepID=A0A5B7F1H8_PORTR|nr:hypothetical protein [Portunus trituberculatus]
MSCISVQPRQQPLCACPLTSGIQKGHHEVSESVALYFLSSLAKDMSSATVSSPPPPSSGTS